MNSAILTGQESKDRLELLLNHEELRKVPDNNIRGFHLDEAGNFVTWDNISGKCFVEDWKTEEEAMEWLTKYHS